MSASGHAASVKSKVERREGLCIDLHLISSISNEVLSVEVVLAQPNKYANVQNSHSEEE